MKTRSKFMLAGSLLGMLCMVWLGAADPATAFDAVPGASDRRNNQQVHPADTLIRAQFFDRERRRDNRYRGRRGRNRGNDLMPLRNDPGEGQIRMRELRRRDRDRGQRQDQDTAREAVRRGDILPLDIIIRSAQSYCPGRLLDARLRRSGDAYSYWVRILSPSGQRIGLTVDAQSGAVIGGSCR
jgi:hypothetical protein